ncbi:MAG TPA: phosphoribosyltransferase family protein, partial [Actinomycetota bacterium]|nr:phosphoribosyltransferase family protein [Actinomycetota bacterium]
RAEQQAMRDYAATESCLMEFLRRQLDDPEAAPCGRCANCTGERLPVAVDREMVARALAHLRGTDLLIEPRKMWASGVSGLKGRIPPEHLSEPGRALGAYGDGAWGASVRRARNEGGAFSSDLLEASAALIRERWKPAPEPSWVTYVPSERRPEQVPAFAEALAGRLGLPFQAVVRQARPHRPQGEMENSAQQLRNVHGAFAVAGALPSGPVLLVDDTIDSGWTLTVVGVALREAGAGPVHPFVLAKVTGA